MTVVVEFLGTGGAHSEDLGSSSARISLPNSQNMLIDFGPDTYFSVNTRKLQFDAIFITHAHLDHVGGLERLFFSVAFKKQRLIKLYVPVSLVTRLHQIFGMAGSQVAEGGKNFWDCFQLIPITDYFYFSGYRFNVFPVRHHFPGEAFGLALPGCFVYTGDTRPIPEQLVAHAGRGELIFHDATTSSNPAHSALDDLKREYALHDVLDRLVLYHFDSAVERELAETQGWKTVRLGVTYQFGCRHVCSGSMCSNAELSSLGTNKALHNERGTKLPRPSIKKDEFV
ncbi:MBL fold metallo-hydrolase [Marinobacter nauticus]|uniref:Beta-lactamase domain protein n=1 Tax=Marinobacter nauticus (strain ATCC 700491 / DSM 11845 / VT8) TaxID=351348 RepID=A1U874_MARN8|nr:MBL fold metallo-hydrolase [Marinobacter nauticus]ABM21193.1 beta-lactamase domain protein [Marinobacter nauticus VT8]